MTDLADHGRLITASMRARMFLKTARRTIREARRAAAVRRAASAVKLAPVRPVNPLGPTDVPLIVPVRNERSRLPPFLAHYRQLGVTRFLIVDDRSRDGTLEYLADQPDVDLHLSDVRFADAAHGIQWRYALARRYGFNRHYLSVDIDEYLVYSGMEAHGLADLFAWMARNRWSRLLAPMIDLYPPDPTANAAFSSERAPWKVATHFDRTGYDLSMKSIGPLISGGAMERLFRIPHFIQKFPVLYWTPRTVHYPNIHNPFPYQLSQPRVLGCLLHFKLFADLEERARAAIIDKQYVGEAYKYRSYVDRLAAGSITTPSCAESIRYTGPGQFVELGLMEKIDWPDGCSVVNNTADGQHAESRP